MPALPIEQIWTADEYLAWESEQPTKFELIDNYIVAMSGASEAHSIIAVAIAALLYFRLREKPCKVYAADMRVQVKRQATYTYPDVVVVCGQPRFRADTKPATLQNPTLIFEALSPSTEDIDRGRKFAQYLQLPSLEGYFLVSQDVPRVESYTRQADGWLYQDHAGLDAKLRIDAIGVSLSLEDIYHKVPFEQCPAE